MSTVVEMMRMRVSVEGYYREDKNKSERDNHYFYDRVINTYRWIEKERWQRRGRGQNENMMGSVWLGWDWLSIH